MVEAKNGHEIGLDVSNVEVPFVWASRESIESFNQFFGHLGVKGSSQPEMLNNPEPTLGYSHCEFHKYPAILDGGIGSGST